MTTAQPRHDPPPSTLSILLTILGRYLERLRTGGWPAVAIYLAIALIALVVLVELLKKTNAGHLTIGAGMVLLIYLAVGAFLALASRVFVTRAGDR